MIMPVKEFNYSVAPDDLLSVRAFIYFCSCRANLVFYTFYIEVCIEIKIHRNPCFTEIGLDSL